MQQDKVLHFAVGFAIGAVGALVHEQAGAPLAAIAGRWKERYDARRPDRHTEDGWDAFATAAGGIAGQCASAVARAMAGW